jgi:hypothetical protein
LPVVLYHILYGSLELERIFFFLISLDYMLILYI